ncbi:Probably inactive leucine-rich repeat receptor-like protein kinase IMK2 [Linum perenne]
MEHYSSRLSFLHVHTLVFCFLSLLASTPQLASSSSHKWDGVAITRSDYSSLRAIKSEFIDFRGALRSWNHSSHGVCSGGWDGIKCVKGRVIAIELPWKGLGGRISEKIGQLQELRRISMHDNVLGGGIPLSIGNLRNLRGVYLFNNQLRGLIPASIGNCLALQALDVSNNSLSGPIPPSLGNSTRIYRMNLSYNSLIGPIPDSFSTSPSLVFLALEHNNLSDSIPDSWGRNSNSSLHQLQFLSLDHNLISGNIPSSLSNLGLLQEISLDHNQITGTIPNELGSLLSLSKLDFSSNAINGTIPSTFSNLSSLVELNLEGNHLTGQIPEAIDRLHNLTVLNLQNNKLDGSIPPTIANISTLTQVDLSRNNFSGEIPASFSRLSYLNVSYNDLSGTVPSVLVKKFNSTSFVGNLQLCGYSSSTPCPSSSPITLPAQPPLPNSSTNHHTRSKLSTRDLILIIAGSVVASLLLLCCCLVCCLMRNGGGGGGSKQKNGKITATGKAYKPSGVSKLDTESGREMGGKLVHFDGPFIFTADDLLCATAEIMGKSAYGTAYKATLEDGNQIAVKRLKEKTTKVQREFEVEAAAIGKIRHPNLLPLRAYYIGPKGEKLLAFDYLTRGSLSSYLHARGPETIIDWPTRMNIAMGIARGLSHLHTKENIIHGNLTSSNVLLDEQTNAYIADFGISRLMTDAAATNVISTAGTLGYRAPELSKVKDAGTKTDVYSLGVIILELLTGKSPGETNNGMALPQWVASIVKEEWTNEVFDLEISKDSSTTTGDELLNTLKLALHCVDPLPSARPEAGQVLQQLEVIMPEVAAVAVAPAESDDVIKTPPYQGDVV